MSLSDDVEAARLEALLARALQVQGADVRFLVFRSSRQAVRQLRALGGGGFVYYEDHAPARGLVPQDLLSGRSSVRELKEIEYRGARIGRQALSTVVRARHDPAVDLGDPAVQADLGRTLEYGAEGVHAGESVLQTVRPDVLLMVERGYAGVGALSDVALQRGIPVVGFGSAHRDDAFFLKRYRLNNRDLQHRSLDERTWQLLLEEGWNEAKERELEAELARREQGKWFLAKRVRPGVSRRSPDELRAYLGLDPGRKVAVLFPHVLWDASMFYGTDVYPDQGAWFRETVRLACEDDSVQWLVKLHPALLWKLRVEGAGEPAELRLIREAVGELPAHVKLLMPDADVAHGDLLEIVDAGVTIRGTVGLELPRLGIPVLTAGTSDYAGRGFTVDAGTVKQYEANIRGVGALPRLDQEQIRLARLYAYGVFVLRPWIFSSFALEYLPAVEAEDTLLHRLRYRVRTEQELREAADLREFAAWVLSSDEADYLRPQGRSTFHAEAAATAP